MKHVMYHGIDNKGSTLIVCVLVFAAGSVVCHSKWGSRNQLPRQQDGDSVHGQQLWHLSLLGQAVYARRSPHQGRRLPGEDLKRRLISSSNSEANDKKNTRNNFCSLCRFFLARTCVSFIHTDWFLY